MEESQRMRTGILERVLIRQYGQPISCIRRGMAAKAWNTDRPDDEAVLYMGMKWNGIFEARFSSLKPIYGDSCGGYLVKNTLKAAILMPRKIYGVWNIDDLRIQPEVQRAIIRDPAVEYFMDENNVCFYGVKAGLLYCFDDETDEFDCLGPTEQALEEIMDSYKEAFRDDYKV